jgi:hypothetical protein
MQYKLCHIPPKVCKLSDDLKLQHAKRFLIYCNRLQPVEQLRPEYEASKVAILTKAQAIKATFPRRPTPHGSNAKDAQQVPQWEASNMSLGQALSSVAYFRLKDRNGWVKVQITTGDQVPEP